MQQARGKQSVAVGGDAGVVVTGDHNQVVTAPPVRSAYWEQVRRIAPAELVDREEELAALSAFCRADSGPAYTWWRAEAWAGKTALLSWFALNPPEGVRIVPFFITARLGAQNDVVAYVDVVLEQLAELAGEGLPALLTAATREAHLLRLYGEAARACAERGERLILLVDGLDEDRGVTTGPDAHSIASLLPYDVPVIVSGRLNPPLPVDVPAGHPLHDPAIVRILEPSPYARAIRTEAERELKRLLTAGGVAYDLLGLLLAAGGGLTADDLAELTGEVPYRVRDVLRTGQGRTFAVRSGAYLLAHEELQAQAREMLGERELDRYRGVVCGWAEEWRSRGWPERTPSYLLHGYVPMLRAAGEAERMVACALDRNRHDRLLAATGGDATALGEVTGAGETLLARGDHPGLVTTLLRLALRRAALRDRNGQVPAGLPAAWAELGEVDRALALARALEPTNRLRALCGVAEVLHGGGDSERAHALLAEADPLARETHGSAERPFALWAIGASWLAVGAIGEAESAMDELGPILRRRPLLDLVETWCRAGDFGRALDALRGESEPETRAMGLATVCTVLAGTGREAAAEQLARSTADGMGRALALVRIAAVLRGSGRRERADELIGEALGSVVVPDAPAVGGTRLGAELVGALVEAGAADRAEELTEGPAEGPADGSTAGPPVGLTEGRRDRLYIGEMRLALLKGLTLRGDLDRAERMLGRITGRDDPDHARVALIEGWARTGELERIVPVLDLLTDPFKRPRAVRATVGALVRAGRLDEAETLVAGESEVTDPHGLALAVDFVRELTGAGHRDRASALLARVETVSRVPPREETAGALAAVAEALALAGHLEPARALTEGLEAGTDREPRLLRVVRALIATGRFDEARTRAEGARSNQRDYLLDLVARGRRVGGLGGVDRARGLAAEFARPGKISAGCELVVLSENRADPESCHGGRPEYAEDYAERARALHEEGRHEEASQELARAVREMRGVLEMTGQALAEVVRAQMALGRVAEAAALLAEAERCLPFRSGREVSFVARAFVAAGEYDRAVDLVRTPQPSDQGVVALIDLVQELARAGEHDRGASILAEFAHLGSACTPAYVTLAVEHPDPVRAREFTALALHLGPWHDAVPAVLHCEPGTVDLVVEEGERLRTRFRQTRR